MSCHLTSVGGSPEMLLHLKHTCLSLLLIDGKGQSKHSTVSQYFLSKFIDNKKYLKSVLPIHILTAIQEESNQSAPARILSWKKNSLVDTAPYFSVNLRINVLWVLDFLQKMYTVNCLTSWFLNHPPDIHPCIQLFGYLCYVTWLQWGVATVFEVRGHWPSCRVWRGGSENGLLPQAHRQCFFMSLLMSLITLFCDLWPFLVARG